MIKVLAADGEILFEGETLRDVVKNMKHYDAEKPKNITDYMQKISQRCEQHFGTAVRTSSCEAFITDMIKHKFMKFI